MRIHRFYVGDEVELKHNFWLHDERLLWQWRKVLRMQPGQELVLFDGLRSDRLYKLLELTEREAHLEYITDYHRQTPKKDIYLLWSLLKKDKNDWVLQKCTELGVSHFVPLLAERSEKTGFNEERARKIVIEATEQCGRSDIPAVREPLHVQTVLEELNDKITLFVAEKSQENTPQLPTKNYQLQTTPMGILIGPEGGWSEQELELFKQYDLQHLQLGDFTLRAETATISAATQLLQ